MKILISLIIMLLSSTAFAGWKSNSEIGYVSQSGNTEQENAFIKLEVTDKHKKGELKLNAEYINSSGEDDATMETTTLAESALAKLQYTFGKPEQKIGPFVSALWEKNRFAGFDNRYSGDAGVRYKIIDDEGFKLYNETGYRYREQYAATVGSARGEETESQFLRVNFNLEKSFTKTSTFQFFIETMYDFLDSENIEVIFEPSLRVAIGEFFSTEERPAQVSLNVSYRGIFDNVPAQTENVRYDSIVSTGLKVIY